jgi:pimeloyl-ACP methyl ester carboxylesterase
VTEYLEADGQRLEVRFLGTQPGSGRPTLVFLHEGLGSLAMWRDFPDRVSSATGLGALVYSRRGYGASDPVPLPRSIRFMHEEAWEVLPALLDTAGVTDCILIGHSDGASIALLYAARPSVVSVRGVIAMAPHVFVEEVTVASIARAAEAFRTTDLRSRLARYHGENVDGAFWGWNRVWLDPDFRKWTIEEEIPRIVAPLLVVQGEDDEYGTLAQVESIRRRATARVETLVLPKCGHSPQRDQPEATLSAIATFVGGIVSR